jgi:hypothetical protein
MPRLAVQLVRGPSAKLFSDIQLTIHSADMCQPSLQAAPVCADSSWNLWNTTNVDGAASDGYTGYLCCLAGQFGIQGNVETVGMSAICVDPGTPFPQSVSGTLVSSFPQTLSVCIR